MSNRFCRVTVRYTPEEMKLLCDRMEGVGTSNISAYIRKQSLMGYVIEVDMSGFKNILRLISIESNNLNQYARRANETGSIYKADIDELKKSHDQLIKLMGEQLDRFKPMQ